MLSIIIPFHNEEKNLTLLYEELKDVLNKTKKGYEVIFINDGSTDKSAIEVIDINKKDNQVRLINLRKKFGKGHALLSGIKQAKGETLVFLDADLQDDPKYLPEFLKKIEEGYDFINGARVNRQDNFLIKIYTKISNKLLKLFLKSPFNDINCGFKVLKKNILDEIVLYGNNFRFLPLAVQHAGFSVAEIKVINRPRINGRTKYGISKLFIGIADFVTANFLYRFSERPLHFFGIIGGVFFLIGFLTALFLSVEKLFFGTELYRRPLLLFAILFIIVGIQIVMTGIIGELIVYAIRKKVKSV